MVRRVDSTLLLFLITALLALIAIGGACGDDDDDDNDAVDDDNDNDNDDNDDDDDANPFLNPTEPGPYLVGNTSFFFEDTTRPLSCAPGNRVLLTEVWYPAADGSDSLPENYITDFFLGRTDEIEQALRDAGIDPEDELNDLPTGSYRDAPLHPDATAMPILVFSHGFSSNRFQNFTMADFLASHGYLVIAPDHICNSQVTLTPDDVVLMSPLNALVTLSERQGDVSFLVDVLLDNPPAMFAGRLDTESIGFWGHSFGGVTVTEQFKRDLRVDALVQLASFGFPGVPDEVTGPSLYFYGYQDKWMHPFKSWHDTLIQQMPTPKMEAVFFGTGHFAFSDLCRFSPVLADGGNGCGAETRIGSDELFTNPDHDALHAVLNAYTTAFFGAAFFGYAELAHYLGDNHFPGMMDYTTYPGQGD